MQHRVARQYPNARQLTLAFTRPTMVIGLLYKRRLIF